ncbi:MAG: extracellular solute-binding protein, partial [Acetobacteraceae bacterium]|nr:extracellular solute-binding protein [Acetobacteraceae bacterium]
MMKRCRVGLTTLVLCLALCASARAATQIEYWQYTFKERVDAMDELIRRFQQANPDIAVKQVTVPYDNFRARVAAAVSAGEGPDVVQLYYGWLPAYIAANLLQKLPSDAFDTAAIDRDFFPIVQAMKRDGAYYALPTAVRALALFWNKTLFKNAGLDPNTPPQTLDDLVADAQKATKRDAGGNLLVEGFAPDMSAQDQHWLREVLIRQFGGAPYSADGKTPTFDSPAGVAAVTWYTDLITKERVGELGFMTDQATAFRAGRAALTVDGSFRVSGFDAQRGLDYGIAELPSRNGVRGNFASYWVNGITAKATGDKRAAAVKFLQFVTAPEAMELWVHKVGELPARVAVANAPAIRDDPKYGPFVRGLAYATTTQFADESQQRTEFMDMIDRVV